MTDYYAVLINSLKRQNIWDANLREQLYERARSAIVKKLWAIRPPLSADEIRYRVDQFEAAVDQVENDVLIAERFRQFGPAEQEFRAGDGRRRTARPPPDGSGGHWADEEVDGPLVEAAVLPAAARSLPPPPPVRGVAPQRRRQAPRQLGEADDAFGGPDDDYYDREAAWERSTPDWRTTEPEYYDDAADDEQEPDRHETHARGSWHMPDVVGRLFQRRDDPHEDSDDGPAPRLDIGRLRAYLDRSIAHLRGGGVGGGYGEKRSADGHPERRLGRYAAIGVVVLAAGLAVWVLFVLVPLLRGTAVVTERGDESRGVAAAGIRPDPIAAKIAGLPTEMRISLFDGRDPALFKSGTQNPVNFDATRDGGFARIASSVSAAGVRAEVGPGVMQRIAGKNVRVLVAARSSRERGATKLRFAFQAGNRVSPWKESEIGRDFAVIELIWQVPPDAANAGSSILLEPGLPGGASGADIKSIVLEVLKAG